MPSGAWGDRRPPVFACQQILLPTTPSSGLWQHGVSPRLGLAFFPSVCFRSFLGTLHGTSDQLKPLTVRQNATAGNQLLRAHLHVTHDHQHSSLAQSVPEQLACNCVEDVFKNRGSPSTTRALMSKRSPGSMSSNDLGATRTSTKRATGRIGRPLQFQCQIRLPRHLRQRVPNRHSQCETEAKSLDIHQVGVALPHLTRVCYFGLHSGWHQRSFVVASILPRGLNLTQLRRSP